MYLVRRVEGFEFYLVPHKDGYNVLQIGERVFKYLKKGRVFIAEELAIEFLDKYIKQGTYKENI